MPKKREVRMFSTALRLETRADGEQERNMLVGHAAVFNQRTNLGFFDEVVKPGAFRNTLKAGADVRALVDHDPSRIIGRTKDGGRTGTLRMKEDRVGLHVEIDVADTQAGRDIMESVRRGDVDGMSFGFFVREDGDKVLEEKSGRLLRELRDLELFDVSAVTYPAYEATDLGEMNSSSAQIEAQSITDVYESMPEELRERAEKVEDECLPEALTRADIAEMVREVVSQEVRAALSEVVKPEKGGNEPEKRGNDDDSLPDSTDKVEDPEDKDSDAEERAAVVAKRKRELLVVEHERSLI